MKKLISMTDFVLNVGNPEHTDYQFANLVMAYANFLKTPLTLGMFVPCDDEGNVLEEPVNYNKWCKKALNTSYDLDLSKYDQYQQAKERVLFEGFEVPHEGIALGRFKQWLEFKGNVESLVGSGKLDLTPYALKQIGL